MPKLQGNLYIYFRKRESGMVHETARNVFLVMDSCPVCAKGDKSFKHVFQRCGKWQPGVSQNDLFYSRLGNAIVLPECEEEEVVNSLPSMAALTPLYFGVRWS